MEGNALAGLPPIFKLVQAFSTALFSGLNHSRAFSKPPLWGALPPHSPHTHTHTCVHVQQQTDLLTPLGGAVSMSGCGSWANSWTSKKLSLWRMALWRMHF